MKKTTIARIPRQRRVCARCAYPRHLAGRLVLVAENEYERRWLCKDERACAVRRRERGIG